MFKIKKSLLIFLFFSSGAHASKFFYSSSLFLSIDQALKEQEAIALLMKKKSIKKTGEEADAPSVLDIFFYASDLKKTMELTLFKSETQDTAVAQDEGSAVNQKDGEGVEKKTQDTAVAQDEGSAVNQKDGEGAEKKTQDTAVAQDEGSAVNQKDGEGAEKKTQDTAVAQDEESAVNQKNLQGTEQKSGYEKLEIIANRFFPDIVSYLKFDEFAALARTNRFFLESSLALNVQEKRINDGVEMIPSEVQRLPFLGLGENLSYVQKSGFFLTQLLKGKTSPLLSSYRYLHPIVLDCNYHNLFSSGKKRNGVPAIENSFDQAKADVLALAIDGASSDSDIMSRLPVAFWRSVEPFLRNYNLLMVHINPAISYWNIMNRAIFIQHPSLCLPHLPQEQNVEAIDDAVQVAFEHTDHYGCTHRCFESVLGQGKKLVSLSVHLTTEPAHGKVSVFLSNLNKFEGRLEYLKHFSYDDGYLEIGLPFSHQMQDAGLKGIINTMALLQKHAPSLETLQISPYLLDFRYMLYAGRALSQMKSLKNLNINLQSPYLDAEQDPSFINSVPLLLHYLPAQLNRVILSWDYDNGLFGGNVFYYPDDQIKKEGSQEDEELINNKYGAQASAALLESLGQPGDEETKQDLIHQFQKGYETEAAGRHQVADFLNSRSNLCEFDIGIIPDARKKQFLPLFEGYAKQCSLRKFFCVLKKPDDLQHLVNALPGWRHLKSLNVVIAFDLEKQESQELIQKNLDSFIQVMNDKPSELQRCRVDSNSVFVLSYLALHLSNVNKTKFNPFYIDLSAKYFKAQKAADQLVYDNDMAPLYFEQELSFDIWKKQKSKTGYQGFDLSLNCYLLMPRELFGLEEEKKLFNEKLVQFYLGCKRIFSVDNQDESKKTSSLGKAVQSNVHSLSSIPMGQKRFADFHKAWGKSLKTKKN
jgi:hypothetical protein